tara:strand:- start:236 stop:637 length:402 start_codon:yes stop_codon:yes gene_type:complete
MLNKSLSLKINTIILGVIALIDIIRGYMHSFNINYASANIAKIDPHPDAMYLLGVFGMSNFLTAFIYLIIVWKAKHITPYILFIIPFAYLIGIIGLRTQDVQMQSEFNGQYIMFGYFTICLLTSLLYFTSKKQ